jgi:glycosyltransferase involved in cell wall biosynthesis
MIVIVGPAYPYRGGIADTNEALAQALMQKGKEVRIVNFKVLYPRLLFPGKTQFTEKPPPERLFIDRKLNSTNPLSWYKTAQYIKSLHPEWVLFRHWTPFLGPCLKTVASLIGNKFEKIALVDNARGHETKWFDSILMTSFLKEMDGMVCLSHEVKNQLDKKVQKPGIVCSHPIDQNLPATIKQSAARKTLKLGKDEVVLLFFGLIRKYKGVDMLLESIPLLKKSFPKLKVLVVGEPYIPIKPLVKQCEALGITKQVRFHSHFVPISELPLWFGACDWVIQPYRNASQSGITPTAIHYERPTLVTRVGGLSEGLEEPFAKVVEPTSRSIAKGLEKCLRWDKPDTKAFSEIKKTKTWSVFGDKLVDFVQSL